MLKHQFLDKLGAVGAFVVAGSCPACFPLLAAVGSAFGLGFLRPYEGILMYVFQGLVFLALIGNITAFLSHKKAIPFVIGVVSPALIFFAFYIRFNSALIYSGLFGLLVTAVLNHIESRKCRTCV